MEGDLTGENGIGGAMGGGWNKGGARREKKGRKRKEWMGVNNREKGEWEWDKIGGKVRRQGERVGWLGARATWHSPNITVHATVCVWDLRFRVQWLDHRCKHLRFCSSASMPVYRRIFDTHHGLPEFVLPFHRRSRCGQTIPQWCGRG